MNSCTVAYAFYESDIRVRRYAEILAAKGRADAIALRAAGKPKKETIEGVNLRRIQRRDFDAQNGLLHYVFKMAGFFMKTTLLLLINHIRYHYRLIIVHNVPDFFVFAAIIPRLTGARVILDIHDILPELFCERFHQSMNSAYGKVLLAVEKASVRFCDFVITGNDLWRNKIIERTGCPADRCLGFINYTDLRYFNGIRHTVRTDRLSIVYPGHLSYHHGVDIAVRAMPFVLEKIPFATFTIYAGSWIPDFRRSLERLIIDLGLGSVVTIHPSLPIRQLVDIYRNTDIGVVPKRGGIFASEAFSSKILDFMAAGIPIVASRTKIDEHYFNDSMITFFEVGNARDLSHKIVDLYNNAEKREQLSHQGRIFVTENNWDAKKKDFESIVQALFKEQ